MSRYEWESGTISIPRDRWPGFKATIRDAHSAQQRKRLATAERIHAALIRAAAGQRNVDWRHLSHKVLEELKIFDEDAWNIVFALFQPNCAKAQATSGKTYADPMDLRGSAGRPPKPTKSMFPEANGRTMSFIVTDGDITLDEKTRSVHWSVHENNHAIEHARAHPVSQALFQALDRMVWDTKCGGTIVGNNEYNRDDRSEGGGSNTVNARYGRDRTDWEKSLGMSPRGPRPPSRSHHVTNNFYGSPPYRRY